MSWGCKAPLTRQIPFTIEDGEIIVDIGQLPEGSTIIISYEVEVDSDTENGEIVIGRYPLLKSEMKLKDKNGGDLKKGDILEYSINIENKGNAPVSDLEITNQIPEELDYIADSTLVNGELLPDSGQQKDYHKLEAEETITIKYQVEIPETITSDKIIENIVGFTATARAEDTSNPVDAELSGQMSKTVQIGGIPGKVSLSGEAGSLLGNLPEGWIVELWLGDNKLDQKIVTEDGIFEFKGLTPDNNYRILLRHPETEVVYCEVEIEGLTPGTVEDEGLLPMDPSGIIYNSISREPIAGAEVNPIGPDGNPVPESHLGNGQQNQITAADGFYRFDLDFNKASAGEYLIKINPPSGYLEEIPSRVIAPLLDPEIEAYDPSFEPDPFKVVDFETAPAIGEATDYYLSFALEAGDPDILNNHIPVDPDSEDIITISKTAAKKQLTVGDFVSYQIKVENNSAHTLDIFTVYDKLPAGFKYVEGSISIKTESNTTNIDPVGDRLVKWEGLQLESDETMTITYTLLAGTGVSVNKEYINKAYVNMGDSLVSNMTQASVLIVTDPELDGSTIIGKVFNDINANGVQDPGEKGLAGVEIISITGQIITKDEQGRYHLITD